MTRCSVSGQDLPEELRLADSPPWLTEIQRSTPVHFIETQRLLNPKAAEGPNQESMVQKCSNELAVQINATLARSANLSQSLERTFPSRVISTEGRRLLSEQEIRTRLEDLELKRTRLVEAGLLHRGISDVVASETV